jgi:hypothetical protein
MNLLSEGIVHLYSKSESRVAAGGRTKAGARIGRTQARMPRPRDSVTSGLSALQDRRIINNDKQLAVLRQTYEHMCLRSVRGCSETTR